MARYSGKKKVSEETRSQAMKIARGTQTPGQTKAQTRLIAQGIERGIDLYKKEQKEKAREQDRRQRDKRPRADAPADRPDAKDADEAPGSTARRAWLPWLLLGLTWAGIGVFWAVHAA